MIPDTTQTQATDNTLNVGSSANLYENNPVILGSYFASLIQTCNIPDNAKLEKYVQIPRVYIVTS